MPPRTLPWGWSGCSGKRLAHAQCCQKERLRFEQRGDPGVGHQTAAEADVHLCALSGSFIDGIHACLSINWQVKQSSEYR